MLKVEDVLEILSIPLIGIVPESEEILQASNLGAPVTLAANPSAPARAYIDAARRLNGETRGHDPAERPKGLLRQDFRTESGMNLISFFRRPVTAPIAKDRLKLLLAHERGAVGNSDVIALLREEIVAVIAKHFPVESDAIKVRMESGDVISTLEVEVEIPTQLCAPRRMARRRTARRKR